MLLTKLLLNEISNLRFEEIGSLLRRTQELCANKSLPTDVKYKRTHEVTPGNRKRLRQCTDPLNVPSSSKRLHKVVVDHWCCEVPARRAREVRITLEEAKEALHARAHRKSEHLQVRSA